MKTSSIQDDFVDLRSEPRRTAHHYASVEFWVEDLNIFYHCKVRDTSPSGLCILIKEDSQVLNYLKIGQQIQMKCYKSSIEKDIESKHTEVRHIIKQEEGRYKGHVLVGLHIQ